MSILPVEKSVFDRYLETLGIYETYKWLGVINNDVDKVANFGCMNMSEEMFALLWHLAASEITVVEKIVGNLKETQKTLKKLQTTKATIGAMQNRNIQFIVEDMTKTIPSLGNAYYDLAFCKEVLYQIVGLDPTVKQAQESWIAAMTEESKKDYCNAIQVVINKNPQDLRAAIGQMVRIVKPAGYVIAVEPTFGGKCPIDISSFFVNAGLCPIKIPDSPSHAYCYQKPIHSL